jgi:hypothetical protein
MLPCHLVLFPHGSQAAQAGSIRPRTRSSKLVGEPRAELARSMLYCTAWNHNTRFCVGYTECSRNTSEQTSNEIAARRVGSGGDIPGGLIRVTRRAFGADKLGQIPIVHSRTRQSRLSAWLVIVRGSHPCSAGGHEEEQLPQQAASPVSPHGEPLNRPEGWSKKEPNDVPCGSSSVQKKKKKTPPISLLPRTDLARRGCRCWRQELQ